VGEEAELPLLAARLDKLFRTSRPGSKRWTNDEVATELKRANPGVKVTGAYLSALRSGKRTRPSPELQLALARFFGVAPAYFFDAGYAERVDAQLELLDDLSQAGVRSIAARAVGLSPESLAAVTAVLDQVRELQGLPPVQDEKRPSESD
jgi:transcriptional regulator with XRE-family HTH domain